MWTVGLHNIAAVIWIESGDTAFCIRKPYVQGGPKTRYPVLFGVPNLGNSAPILTILSLLQAEIYGA